MSWIVRDLWSKLEAGQSSYSTLLDTDKLRAFEIINRIAHEVGQRHGVLLQLNFPPGQYGPRAQNLGHRDLSILAHQGRKKFEPTSEREIEQVFMQLGPLGFDPLKTGQDGFRARLVEGRIDCLPSGVHLWCEITPKLLEVLDWLFTNEYGLKSS